MWKCIRFLYTWFKHFQIKKKYKSLSHLTGMVMSTLKSSREWSCSSYSMLTSQPRAVSLGQQFTEMLRELHFNFNFVNISPDSRRLLILYKNPHITQFYFLSRTSWPKRKLIHAQMIHQWNVTYVNNIPNHLRNWVKLLNVQKSPYLKVLKPYKRHNVLPNRYQSF